MPRVYRLVKAKFADRALDGSGAKAYGGRWNSKGVALLYAADTLALAALEVLVHLHRTEVLNAFALWTLEVPDDALQLLAPDALPPDWRSDPPPPSTAAIGDEWIASNESLALAVPSTIVPIQYNILINPAHPEFDRLLKTARREAFVFDPRLA